MFAARTPTGAADTQEAAVDNFRRSNALINAGLAESMGGGPLSGSGDDANLSEDALTAKVKKRAEERKTRADAEKKKLDDAETAAKPKRDELKAKKVALEAKQADLAKAEEVLASKQSTLDQREAQLAAREAAVTNTEAALAELPADAPMETRGRITAARNQAVADRDEGIATRDAAKPERDAAKTSRDTAAAAVETAQGEYATAEKAAAETEVGVEAARTALSQYTEMLPGGSVRVAASSARSVSLKETFAKPLVIGYLAYDVEILSGGGLGNHIPTHALLSSVALGDYSRQQMSLRSTYEDKALQDLYKVIKSEAPSNNVAKSVKEGLDSLKRYVPWDLPEVQSEGTPSGFKYVAVPIARDRCTFDDYLLFRSSRSTAFNVLDGLKAPNELAVKAPNGTFAAATPHDLSALRASYEESDRENRAFNQAVRTMMEYFVASRVPPKR